MNNQSNKNNGIAEKEKIQQYSSDTLSRAQKIFIDTSLDDDIYSFDGMDNEILVEKFKNFLPNFGFSELFGDFDSIYNAKTEESKNKKNTLIKALRMKITSSLIPRNNRIEKLLGIFKKEYDISADIGKEVKNIIAGKKGEEVDAMMKSENKRLKFAEELKKFRRINIIDTKENVDSFNEKLEALGIDSVLFQTLNAEQKKALEKFNQTYSDISHEDARAIVSIFPSKKKKLILLQTFMPYVKVGKLLSWGIIDLKEVKNEIKLQVERELGKIPNTTFSNSEIDGVVQSVDYGEIYLDLEKINVNGDVIADIDLESAIVTEINELKKNLRESELKDFYNKLDFEGGDKDIHESFIRFIKKSKDIPLSVKNNIDKFIEGNFLVIKGKNIPDLILQLGETSVGNLKDGKKVQFFDRTATGGMKKRSTIYDFSYSYEEIFDLLKGSAHQEGMEIDFLTETEIKDKKQYKEVFDVSLLDSDVSDENKIKTLEELVSAFDVIDVGGASIPFTKDDMVLYHSGEESETIYEISHISKEDSTITLRDGNVTVDFTEFLSICKKNNIKRKKKIKNSGDFLSSLSSLGGDMGKIYKDLKIASSGKISKKPHGDIVEVCDIFVSENGESIWIEKISDGSIKCHFGIYDEKKKTFKGKYGYTNFDQAFAYISKYEMKPVFEKEKHHDDHHGHDDHDHHPHPHFHGSLLTKYMSFLSAHDISHALHQVAHSIEHSFGHGSHLKSARFARKLGNILPIGSHLRGDLQSTVEQEERKIRDEIMNNLKARGSKDMLETIKHILQGSDVPQYEVEAAMLTVLSKYGTLYPKGLSSMRGDFYWYVRLGGKIGDRFFEETKKKCEDSQGQNGSKSQPIPFTEEYLVEEFMGEHAKAGIRDSRIDKLYGNALGEGIRDEKADGETKAGNKNTSKGKVDYVIGELKNGSYANALGALPKIFSKNGSIEDLHAIPFILTISGVAKNFDQRLLNDVVGITYSTPFTSLGFNLSLGRIELYKKAMIEIAKSLDKEENNGIEKSLKEALSNSNDSKKIIALQEFWNIHGEKMVNRLTLKDHYIMINKKNNDTLNEYYGVMKGIQSDPGDYNPKNEYIDELWFQKTPVAYTGGLLSENDITADPSGDFRGTVSRKNAEMYVNTLEDLKKSNYSEDAKKVIFKEVYGKFEKKMSRLISYHINKKPSELMTIPLYKFMITRGLILSTEKLYVDEFGEDENAFLDKAWEVFRDKKPSGDADEKEVEIVKKGTAEDVMNQLLQSSASNDTHRKKVA